VIDAIVIGSGHAGVAAVAELARLGRTTVLVDVGRVLDDDRVRLVDQLSRLDPPDWDEATVELVSRNPTLGDPLPRRLDFGSEHVYEPDDAPPLPTVRRFPFAPVASLARGGRSNVWGAAVLPTHDRDMNGWPIGRADLEPHYRAVLRSMPLSGARDGLEAEFPIYRDSIDQLTIPPAAQLALDRLESSSLRADPTIVFGRSRLAVTGGHGSSRSCRYCGMCHSGCAYGSIDTATHHLEPLVAAGRVDYRSGLTVRTIEESGGRVVVRCVSGDGRIERIVGDRLFIAGGPIGSTRIVLESLGMWDEPVPLLSTQGFVAPIPLPGRVPRPTASMTLAACFIEFRTPSSPHWVHVQVSPPNELATARMAHLAARLHLPRRATDRAARQFLIALCSMHSDDAGHHVLTLERDERIGHRMIINTVPKPSFPTTARRAARHLRKLLSRADLQLIPPVGPMVGPDPISWHFGGSMPMRARRGAPLHTDVLGRPQGFERTHVVDASVLPAIPATTLALLTMANATRIVHESVQGG
jgi:choline dehydrogenase-like flavoprotein